MELILKGRNIELSDEVKERANQKIKNKVLKYFDKATQIEIELSVEKNPKIVRNNIAEVTVYTPGEIIRSEGDGSDIFEAIDRVASKLERQIKRYHNKLIQRKRKSGENHSTTLQNVEEEIRRQIVKVKTFTIKPITPEEAVMQMELLGHDFFVFINSETDNTAVVYRRKDKNYGLIEPSI